MFFIAIAAYLYSKYKTLRLELKSEKSLRKYYFKQMRERETFADYLDSKLRSERVRFGQKFEQFLPLHKDFPYNRKDCRFLGSPIDYVVFNGLDEDEVKNIVFIEVKSGNKSLTKRERMVRDCIKRGDVSWEIR